MQRLAQLSFMIALGCQFLARPARPAEPSPGPPDDGADVVESVNASESNAPARTPKEQRAANTKLALPAVTERGPVSSAPSPSLAGAEHFRLSAWARQRLELGLTRVRAELPARSVPHDALLSSSVLFAELEYLRSKGFAAVASGFVDYGVAARLRSTDPNLSSSVRADYEARLSELFVGFYGPAVDFRVGQQRVAWGRSDMQSPNDVLNARDLRSPVLAESGLLHVPTPLARLDVRVGSLSFQGIFAPIFVPDRYDLYGSNWALIQAHSPLAVRGLLRLADSLVDSSLSEPFNRFVQQTRLPSAGPRSFSGGGRIAVTWERVDLDAYYQFGFDPTPRIRIDPAFAVELAAIDFSKATPAAVSGALAAQASANPALRIDYTRRHHVGLDACTVVGPIGLRFDAAYDSKRVFIRRDLSALRAPAIQAVGSLEYQTGALDQLYLLEVSALHLFSENVPELLFFEQTTWTGAGVIRVPLLSALRAEVRAQATLRPQSLVVRPELRWKLVERAALSIGALYLTGSSAGFGGYFERNIESYLSLKYEF